MGILTAFFGGTHEGQGNACKTIAPSEGLIANTRYTVWHSDAVEAYAAVEGQLCYAGYAAVGRDHAVFASEEQGL